MLSPGMAGTVKLCVPELPWVADFVGVTDFVGVADLAGRADLVAAPETLCVAGAEVAGVPDDPGALEGPDAEDALDGADSAVAEPPETAEDAAVGEFPPIPAHPARPAPATTTAMITAGILRTPMCFYPSVSNQMLHIVKIVVWVTR